MNPGTTSEVGTVRSRLTDLEFGWLLGVIETDGGIYASHRGYVSLQDGTRKRRPATVTLHIENTDLEMIERVARLLGGASLEHIAPRANAAASWRRPTHRVRLQGRRAVSVYRELLAVPTLMPETRARIERAFEATRTDSASPGAAVRTAGAAG